MTWSLWWAHATTRVHYPPWQCDGVAACGASPAGGDADNRPGGNLTGFSQISGELGAKGIEILHELLPSTPAFGFLVNPRNPIAELTMRDVLVAAHAIGLEIQILRAGTVHEIEEAFVSLVRARTGALLVSNDVFFNGRIDQLVAVAARYAVPTIYSTREFRPAGGLVS